MDFLPIATLTGPQNSFISVIKYSPNGSYLGVGTRDGYAGILDTFSYKWMQEHGIKCSEHHAVLDIDFSENSEVLAAATNSVIIVCNSISGEICRTINVSLNSLFTHLSFGKDKILAAATANFLIYIFDNYEKTDNRLNYKIFNLHLTPITALSFINNSYIISSDGRGYCIIWNSTDYPIPQERFPIFPIKIFNISISPDHKYVLLTHSNSKITSWEILDSAERVQRNIDRSIVFFQTYTGHVGGDKTETNLKAHFWFTPEWKCVISGSENFHIYIWDFETAQIVKRICHIMEPSNITLYALVNPEDGFELISLRSNGTLGIWSMER